MRWFLAITLLLMASSIGWASPSNNVSLKFGGVSFTQDGYNKRSGSASGFGGEWESYPKANATIAVGYKMATDPDSPRLLFQAGYIGTKFYPLTLGRPEKTIKGVSVISVTSSFMPYVGAAFALGRASMQTFGRLGGLEASSEYYGISALLGGKFKLLDFLNGDFEVSYESAQGYGDLAYSGTNIGVMFGVGYFF